MILNWSLKDQGKEKGIVLVDEGVVVGNYINKSSIDPPLSWTLPKR